jgi:hypothetical protein
MNKEAKCEKCKHCVIITQYDIVVCDHLSKLNKSLGVQAFGKPKYCRGFEKRK